MRVPQHDDSKRSLDGVVGHRGPWEAGRRRAVGATQVEWIWETVLELQVSIARTARTDG